MAMLIDRIFEAFQGSNYDFTINDMIVECGDTLTLVEEDKYVVEYGEGEVLETTSPLEVIRLVNRLVRDGKMAQVEKGKEMTLEKRLDLLRERSILNGMHVDGPSDDALDFIEAMEQKEEAIDLPVEKEDEEALSGEEYDAAVDYIYSLSEDIGEDVSTLSKEGVRKKDVDNNIPLTPALEEGLERVGVTLAMLNDEKDYHELLLSEEYGEEVTLSDGQVAIMLIDEKTTQLGITERLEEVKDDIKKTMLEEWAREYIPTYANILVNDYDLKLETAVQLATQLLIEKDNNKVEARINGLIEKKEKREAENNG